VTGLLYKNDWEKACKKFLEFWAKENHDRPLISVTAPRDGYQRKKVKVPEKLEDRWMDIDYVIESSRENMAATYYGGESFPALNPNLGPDILGATIGCEIEFGENTSWAKHFVEDWSQLPDIRFDPENKWWKKIKAMTEAAVEDAKQGDYLVGITDLHPGADGLVSLRGPENLCYDLVDYPDEIKRAAFQVLEVHKQELDELYRITTRYQEGSTHWMGIWHPGKWYNTSSDFICMISKEMFGEFILPELKEELAHVDASIFHLDGPGALKHLDTLLQLPNLNGIQWVYGAGQPSASHWIPVLKKIQDAGKLIQVYIEPDELDILLQELKPEGVMYLTGCNSEEQAKELLKKAEGSYKRKLY
jgi:hypothetical protein